MRDCKRHPGSQSQPGGGVCASCLRERLVWLWRGESFRLDDDDPGDDAQAPARPALVDIASVRKQLQVNGVATKPDPRNNSDAQAATTKKPDVIVEWAEFHAQRRRRNLELESSSSSGSPSMAQISRSLDSLEFKRLMVDNADRSYRSRSMPLDNRSAEETALRVIREVQQADDHLDELDFLDDGGLQMLPEQLQQRRIHRRRSIFFWQSPKWMMKLLVMSPATTSGQNNKKKVFPSRVGSRKRLTRFNSSDWSHTDENWMVSSLQEINTRKVDDMEKHQRRTNVLSWLQVRAQALFVSIYGCLIEIYFMNQLHHILRCTNKSEYIKRFS